jgi:hypothetical protein
VQRRVTFAISVTHFGVQEFAASVTNFVGHDSAGPLSPMLDRFTAKAGKRSLNIQHRFLHDVRFAHLPSQCRIQLRGNQQSQIASFCSQQFLQSMVVTLNGGSKQILSRKGGHETGSTILYELR